MRSLRRALAIVAAVGLVAGAVPLALALESEGGHQRELIVVFGPLTGWAFIAAGIVAWLRRPDNRFGALMTAAGFSACVAALRVSTEPWLFIDGLIFIALPYAVLFHILLAFPSGALRRPLERVLVAVSYASAAVVHPVQLLFQDTTRQGLPENPLLIADDVGVASTLSHFRFWLGLALIAALMLILVARWRTSRGAQRRGLAPVLLSGGLVMGLLGVWYAAILTDLGDDLGTGLEEARVVVLASVPFAFLAGLLRSRVARATAVSELVARLGDPGERRHRLRDALADALGDPTLTLAYWLPDRGEYVDAAGRPVTLPVSESDRLCTPVELAGAPLAAIIHDVSLANERELIRAVGAAAALTLENERLHAQLRAKIEELRASRARLVESDDTARRRLERDLHDGAQQRLVSLALTLRMLKRRVGSDPAAVHELETARHPLEEALEELRELARGIHPSVLSDRGLEAALESLAHRAPVPVELDGELGARLPEPVETTAYFVVAEALTNIAKYSGASHARVSVRRVNGVVKVEVHDDGLGGADPTGGSGLRGLGDRVAAVDGRFEIDSPTGRGTTIRAEIPCA